METTQIWNEPGVKVNRRSIGFVRPGFDTVLLLMLAVAAAGCGGGQREYELSGLVTYQGKPVPAGHIVFEPDRSKGNKGATGFAKIKAGKFDTRQEDGKGTIGGPHLVRILGLDGVARGELINGSPIFPEFTTAADLPKENASKDFEVPRSK